MTSILTDPVGSMPLPTRPTPTGQGRVGVEPLPTSLSNAVESHMYPAPLHCGGLRTFPNLMAEPAVQHMHIT
jgi:hypothetical protein